jgi:hypothetical protein
MGNWIECTRRDGRKVHVNLDQASTVSTIVSANGTSATRIVFPGQPEDYVDVTEGIEQIMKASRRGTI